MGYDTHLFLQTWIHFRQLPFQYIPVHDDPVRRPIDQAMGKSRRTSKGALLTRMKAHVMHGKDESGRAAKKALQDPVVKIDSDIGAMRMNDVRFQSPQLTHHP